MRAAEGAAWRGGATVFLFVVAGAGRAGPGRQWQLRALAGLRQSPQWQWQRRRNGFLGTRLLVRLGGLLIRLAGM